MKSTTIRSALWILSRLVLLWYLYPPPVVAQVKGATMVMKQPSEPLTLLWGIADTMAYVGKLFNYTLPGDAFQGNIVHYNITEVGKDTLPSWLIFNTLKTEFRGIPGPEDKGHIYLEVKTTGDDNSKISDVFSIVVIDDTDNPYTSEQISMETSPKMVICRREEPRTLVTVIVDCDLDLMKPNEKLNLIENMVSYLNLAPEMIKLMPVGNKPMIDSGALVVGPGNIKESNFVGAFISWLAGCGQVTNEHMTILQQVESSAATGDMSSALGRNIVGWHVTNTRFLPKPRKRRNVTPTPTLMHPAPSTVIPVTSRVIPVTSRVIPVTSRVIPVTSRVIPVTSRVIPVTSRVIPVTSRVIPVTSRVIPVTSRVIPVTSRVIPVTSRVIPVTSRVIPVTSRVIPVTSRVIPVTSRVIPVTSRVIPVTSRVIPVTSRVIPVTSRVIPVTSRVIPVTSRVIPVTSRVIPVTSRVIPVTSRVIPVTSRVIPVTSRVIPVTSRVIPVTSRVIPVTSRVIPVTSRVIPVTSRVIPVTSRVIPVTSTVIPVTSRVQSSSDDFIKPSKPIVMQTTVLVETRTKVTVPSSVVSTGKVTDVITTSETVGMTITIIPEATEILPTKVITIKSDVVTPSSVTPFTPSTVASATLATSTRSSTTASLTPPVPTSASTTKAPAFTQAPATSKPLIIKPTVEVIHPDLCLDKSQIIKSVLAITINVGEIKRHKIAEDTFADCYNLNTSDMTIEITHSNGTDLLSSFWLQLTKATHYYINANPLKLDVGNHTFIVNRLVDDLKKISMGTIAVHVVKLEDTSNLPNHELSIKIETDYDKFMSELMKRLELANKVSQIFGDKSSKALSVTMLERGSVIYAWTNNSLVRGICPVEDIKELVDKMFTQNGDLTPGAIMTMHPYTVKHAISVPLGSCIGHPDFPTRSTMKSLTTAKSTTAKPVTAALTTKYLDKVTSSKYPSTFKYVVTDTDVTVESAEITTKAQLAAGVGVTTVVPAIVVVCALVIAGIIACCLYRKTRKSKGKLEGENNFSNNKDVPVIFTDDYEEKTNDSTRPLIMEDEKPPMQSLDYQRVSSENSDKSNSTLLEGDRSTEEIEMEETETSPLYSPPPPVTTSNNSKPPHLQSLRRPPPYVPP